MKKLVSFLFISIFCLGFLSAQRMGEVMGGPRSARIITETSPETETEIKTMPFGLEERVKVEFVDAETEKQRAEQLTRAGESKALYSFPDGYYIMGLSSMGTRYSDNVAHIYGPAFYVEGAYWKNLSENADAYMWNFFNPEYVYDSSASTDLVSNEFEPQALSYPMTHDPAGLGYPSPLLTTYSGAQYDEYVFGLESYFDSEVENIVDFYMYLGGRPSGYVGTDPVSYGITNVDHYNFKFQTTRIDNSRDKELDFFFGSNKGTADLTADGNYYVFDGCAEEFSKPLHPYILDGVRICLSRYLIAKDTKLEIIIHRFENGAATDTIATSSWIADKDYEPDDETLSRFSYFKFDDFRVKNAKGEEEAASWIVISDAILVEFKGYNDEEGFNQIAVADQAGTSWNKKSTAYLYRCLTNSKGETIDRDLLPTAATALKERSLAFMLDVTYSFMVPERGTDTKIEFDKEGGSKTIAVNSYFLPVEYEKDENGKIITEVVELEGGYKTEIGVIKEIIDGIVMWTNKPDWLDIEITEVYNRVPNREITYLKFTAEPSETPRWAEPIVFNLGAEQKFIVTVGDVTSVGENKVNEVKVTKSGESFELTYTNGFKSVAIYNVAGQKVYEGALQDVGTTNVSAAGLDKGMYIFKFAGSKTETVKFLN